MVCKIDLSNAFNEVSRNALLTECATHFLVLFKWVYWCYGDIIFCGKFMAQKRTRAARLMTQLTEVGSIDPQITLLLLRHCASFCRFVHLARSTPPPLISDGLALFDADVRRHFSDCVATDASDSDADVRLMRKQAPLHISCLPSPSPPHPNFDQLFLAATPANYARLLSVASCHTSSWLSVIPA